MKIRKHIKMYDKIKMSNISAFKKEMVSGLKKAFAWEMWEGVFTEEEINNLFSFLEGCIFDAEKLLAELPNQMTKEEILAVFDITNEQYSS